MTESPIALEAYDELAEAYANAIDTKPHNAYYERPATLSLLPPVQGLRVLDAGCGSGVYAEWLLDHGAEVVGIDASPNMVRFARQRTQGRADIRLANLAEPLVDMAPASFDLVVCPLVLEYVRDWRAVLAEFHRVLRPDGRLIVSVTHPLADFAYFKSKAYFETELVHTVWTGFTPVRVRMPSYRRSLAETINPFAEVGFHIDTLLEPRPTEAFKAADPRHYAELNRQPAFLCIRAVKVVATSL
jgi:SAM-dependent methyltransferase